MDIDKQAEIFLALLHKRSLAEMYNFIAESCIDNEEAFLVSCFEKTNDIKFLGLLRLLDKGIHLQGMVLLL